MAKYGKWSVILSWGVSILFLYLIFKVVTSSVATNSGSMPATSDSLFNFNAVEAGYSHNLSSPVIVALDLNTIITSVAIEDVVAALEDLADDDNVLGVVLRVNSPGGGVTASEFLRISVERFAHKKPIYVAIYEVGASGGYMASLPAHRIYALNTSIVGSIGVISQLVEVTELLDKVGVNVTTVKAGQYKAVGDPSQVLTDDELLYQQNLITELYNDFLSMVAQARGMSEEQVADVAEGKIYTGASALKFGLIDEIGDFNDAFEGIKSEIDLPSEELEGIELVEYQYAIAPQSILGAVGSLAMTGTVSGSGIPVISDWVELLAPQVSFQYRY